MCVFKFIYYLFIYITHLDGRTGGGAGEEKGWEDGGGGAGEEKGWEDRGEGKVH